MMRHVRIFYSSCVGLKDLSVDPAIKPQHHGVKAVIVLYAQFVDTKQLSLLEQFLIRREYLCKLCICSWDIDWCSTLCHSNKAICFIHSISAYWVYFSYKEDCKTQSQKNSKYPMIINDSIVSEGFVILFIKSSRRYNFYTGIKDI